MLWPATPEAAVPLALMFVLLVLSAMMYALAYIYLIRLRPRHYVSGCIFAALGTVDLAVAMSYAVMPSAVEQCTVACGPSWGVGS